MDNEGVNLKFWYKHRYPGWGGGHYYNYTPCAFSLKIIDPLHCGLHLLNPTPLLRTDRKYTHPLLQSKVPPFADIPKCSRTGQDSY
jgi:hypothetical protein